MAKNTIRSLKGTRDFYPEYMAARTWLYNKMRQVSESYGYQEYEGPFLESIELYAAKSGEELVKEQSFVFPDRGGDLITLRPELTPTLARMVAQRQNQLAYPLRWWSFGPFWRYERPQKGRSREFFQWNIDLIGIDTPESDGELLAVLADFFRAVGLGSDQVQILVNNRRLMDSQFENLGIPVEQRPQVLRLIDRRAKMTIKSWEAYANEIGLDDNQQILLVDILSNDELWRESEEMQRVISSAQALGAGEYIRYAPNIIRGLDYYTGTVFEAWDKNGEFRAIVGGGRYDDLVSDVGGQPLPGVGFAMGDVVIGLVLKKFNCLPITITQLSAPVLVTIFNADGLLPAFEIATELRNQGLNINCYPEPAKLGKQFKYADRMGMQVVLVLGPDEIAQDKVTIKNLLSGSQQTVPRAAAAAAIRQTLAGQSAS